MKKRVKLSALGFSFNQTQSGTYGLVLGEDAGLRRLMIIIGTPEAQSIAFKLHNTKPPRPLTHDLIQSILNKFAIKLKEVVIYKYDNGVFFSRLVFTNAEGENVTINSRTSDAIAIALRTRTPIYTTEAIMEDLGVVLNETEFEAEQTNLQNEIEESRDKVEIQNSYASLTDKDLEILLQDAIRDEDYEMASLLKGEIDKRKESKI